jgi:hypothetical protein
MQKLSLFLANHISKQNSNKIHVAILSKQIRNALIAYTKHLKEDRPKTMRWAEIEKEIISALGYAEAPSKIGEKNNINKCRNCGLELHSTRPLICPNCKIYLP